jgi:hypothetical protein
MFTLRAAGNAWPSLRAFCHRSRSITEMVSGGMPSRELNACAVMNRKKIIGSHRISDAIVRALAVLALRPVPGFGFWKKPRNSPGPPVEVKA